MNPPTMYPYFGYKDAAAVIEWFQKAFAFEIIQVNNDTDGVIMHAEMRFGNAALMIGTSPERVLPTTPADHGIYVYVEDVDAHYRRASAAGAQIVYPPEDTGWGTRRYRVRDPEGYEWSFGSYRPTITQS
ncbi:MAG: VOC family protein [Chloroflexota bacterium]